MALFFSFLFFFLSPLVFLCTELLAGGLTPNPYEPPADGSVELSGVPLHPSSRPVLEEGAGRADVATSLYKLLMLATAITSISVRHQEKKRKRIRRERNKM